MFPPDGSATMHGIEPHAVMLQDGIVVEKKHCAPELQTCGLGEMSPTGPVSVHARMVEDFDASTGGSAGGGSGYESSSPSETNSEVALREERKLSFLTNLLLDQLTEEYINKNAEVISSEDEDAVLVRKSSTTSRRLRQMEQSIQFLKVLAEYDDDGSMEAQAVVADSSKLLKKVSAMGLALKCIRQPIVSEREKAASAQKCETTVGDVPSLAMRGVKGTGSGALQTPVAKKLETGKVNSPLEASLHKRSSEWSVVDRSFGMPNYVKQSLERKMRAGKQETAIAPEDKDANGSVDSNLQTVVCLGGKRVPTYALWRLQQHGKRVAIGPRTPSVPSSKQEKGDKSAVAEPKNIVKKDVDAPPKPKTVIKLVPKIRRVATAALFMNGKSNSKETREKLKNSVSAETIRKGGAAIKLLSPTNPAPLPPPVPLSAPRNNGRKNYRSRSEYDINDVVSSDFGDLLKGYVIPEEAYQNVVIPTPSWREDSKASAAALGKANDAGAKPTVGGVRRVSEMKEHRTGPVDDGTTLEDDSDEMYVKHHALLERQERLRYTFPNAKTHVGLTFSGMTLHSRGLARMKKWTWVKRIIEQEASVAAVLKRERALAAAEGKLTVDLTAPDDEELIDNLPPPVERDCVPGGTLDTNPANPNYRYKHQQSSNPVEAPGDESAQKKKKRKTTGSDSQAIVNGAVQDGTHAEDPNQMEGRVMNLSIDLSSYRRERGSNAFRSHEQMGKIVGVNTVSEEQFVEVMEEVEEVVVENQPKKANKKKKRADDGPAPPPGNPPNSNAANQSKVPVGPTPPTPAPAPPVAVPAPASAPAAPATAPATAPSSTAPSNPPPAAVTTSAIPVPANALAAPSNAKAPATASDSKTGAKGDAQDSEFDLLSEMPGGIYSSIVSRGLSHSLAIQVLYDRQDRKVIPAYVFDEAMLPHQAVEHRLEVVREEMPAEEVVAHLIGGRGRISSRTARASQAKNQLGEDSFPGLNKKKLSAGAAPRPVLSSASLADSPVRKGVKRERSMSAFSGIGSSASVDSVGSGVQVKAEPPREN